MNNNKLIAQALLDIAKNSETTFIEVSEDKELIEAAKKLGIVLPSPDLAVIKTIYAEIDKVNRNGVVLPKNAVEKGLPTLIGKQINWEHEGSGRICGYIIDAKINKDKIEIIGVVFKSLFPEEMEEVKEKFAVKKLAVSFEIWNRNPEDGKSVVHELDNGFYAIDPIVFHGCGLLLAHQPACPKAYVYKLLAKKEIENAEKIVDKIFEEDLICASMAIEEPKCKGCNPCTCEKEVIIVEDIKLEEILENDYDGGEIEEAKKLTTEQRNALPDSDFALIQERDGKKIRRFPINDEAHVRNALARLPQAKDITEEEKKSALAKILKKAKELNMDELLKKYEKSSEETKTEETTVETKTEDTQKVEAETKVEETKVEEKTEEKSEVAETKTEETTKVEETKEEVVVEEKKEEATIVTTTQEVTKVDEIKPEGEIITTEVKTETKVVNDDGKEVQKVEEEVKTVVTYTFEQVQEQVRKALEIKEAELASLKTELENLDKEIKNMKDELGKKDQEIAELKNPKVEEKKEKEMTVGAVETKTKSEIKKQAENVNKIIAEKHNQ